jgi:hypothetical protein
MPTRNIESLCLSRAAARRALSRRCDTRLGLLGGLAHGLFEISRRVQPERNARNAQSRVAVT